MVTFVNVYVLTVVTVEPFTVSVEIVNPLLAVMVKVWLFPDVTVTDPDGEIEPPVPAEAVIV